MYHRLALLGIAFSGLLVAHARAQVVRQGQLTFIVRDDAGQRVPGVTLTLIHDSDDGRVLIGSQPTDASGTATWPGLALGLYLIQFGGTTPDGAALVPLAAQNLGMLDDGGSLGGGFGIRFVDPPQTELFVLGRVASDARIYPMFDQAAGPNAPPQRVDPLLARVEPPATPTASRPVTAAPQDRWALGLLGGGLWLLAVGVLVGWLRTRRAAPRPEDRP